MLINNFGFEQNDRKNIEIQGVMMTPVFIQLYLATIDDQE